LAAAREEGRRVEDGEHYPLDGRLRSRGKVPEIAAVKEWIKDLL
jgi:hypothetical protein